MTLRLSNADGDSSLLMRINPLPRHAAWRNPWPEGIEGGVCIAGDPLFGAVAFVPSSGELFLMQSEEWEELAGERKQVDAGRSAKAEQAGLTRRIF